MMQDWYADYEHPSFYLAQYQYKLLQGYPMH